MSQEGMNSPVDVFDLTRRMTFNLGTALEYIVCAGFPDVPTEIVDLEKAVFYIQDEIKRVPDHKAMIFWPGHLPAILAGKMRLNRGSAVKAVCLGDTKSLKDALGYLGMEIEELRNKDLGKS